MADVALQVLVETEVKRALRDLQGFGRQAGDTISRLRKASTGMALAGAAATATLSASIVTLGRGFLAAAAEAELFEASFETLLQSAERGRDLFGEIREFAAATPFRIPELAKASQQLLAFGTAQDEVIERLEEIGNLSLGTADKLQRLVLAYGKVQAKGRATMEEINQFTEAGVPLLQALAQQLGITEQELFKLIETGRIGFPEVEEAVTGLATGTGQFAGGMELASQTLAGLMSTLEDNISMAGQELVVAMIEPLKDLIELATQAARSFGAMNEGMRKGVLVAGALVAALGPLTLGITAAVAALGSLALPVTAAVAGLALVGTGVVSLVATIRTLRAETDETAAAMERLGVDLGELGEMAAAARGEVSALGRVLPAEGLRSMTASVRDFEAQLGDALDAVLRMHGHTKETLAALDDAQRLELAFEVGVRPTSFTVFAPGTLEQPQREWQGFLAGLETDVAKQMQLIQRRFLATGDAVDAAEERVRVLRRALESLAEWEGVDAGELDTFFEGLQQQFDPATQSLEQFLAALQTGTMTAGQTIGKFAQLYQHTLAALQQASAADVMAPFQQQLGATDRELTLFGDEAAAAARRVEILEAALRAVAASDLDLNSHEVRELRAELESAREELAALAPSGLLAPFTQQLGTAARELQLFGDAAATAQQRVNILEAALRAVAASDLDLGSQEVRELQQQLQAAREELERLAVVPAPTAAGLLAQTAAEAEQALHQQAAATQALQTAEQHLQAARASGQAGEQRVAVLARQIALLQQLTGATAAAATAEGLYAGAANQAAQESRQLTAATEALQMAEQELARAKQAGADPAFITHLERTVELLEESKDAAAAAGKQYRVTFETVLGWAQQASQGLQAAWSAQIQAQEHNARIEVELLRRTADEKEAVLSEAKREAETIYQDQVRSLKASYAADDINREQHDAKLAELQAEREERYSGEADVYKEARNEQLKAAYDAELAAFKSRKSAALIQIAIDTALAVARTLGSIPFPFSLIPAGLAAVAGAAQLLAVSSQNPPPEPQYLQRGGIVTRPTRAVIGEAGPEAVIPLDRPGIAPALGTGQTIQVTVYVSGSVMTGDDLARQIATSIRRQQERGRIAPWR